MAGAGKAFCAGHDLKEMRAHPDKELIQDIFRRCSNLMLTLTRMPQPVIARVHGIAAGKKVFYEQLDTGLDRAYALATDAMVCNMMTADVAEGIDAFMQKRPPQWQGK